MFFLRHQNFLPLSSHLHRLERILRIIQCISVFLVLCCGSTVWCQTTQDNYPSKNIKLYIDVPAGGTTDQISRFLAEKLSILLAPQTVIPINLDGAGGAVAEKYLRASPPDGYTLLATPPGIIMGPSIAKDAIPDSSLEPVIIVGSFPNAIIARPSLASKTLDDLVQNAKKHNTTLTCASQGVGTTSHLNCLNFEIQTGVHIIHVPYRGTGPALAAILADQVDLFFGNPQIALGHYEQKKVLILAIMDKKKLSNAPQIPTVYELKYPGLLSGSWIAIVAPPNTPSFIAAKLNWCLQKIIGSPAGHDYLKHLNVYPIGEDLAATRLFIKQEMIKNQSLMLGIRKQFGGLQNTPS